MGGRAAAIALALLSVAACVGTRGNSTPPLAGSASIATDASMAAVAAQIRGAAGPRRLVVLGEMHGTREVPLLVAALVESYAADGPVRIALELPHAQQAALGAWVGGSARETAVASITAADPGWSRDAGGNDGRRNLELLDLLDRLRELRAAGRDVDVLAFDVAGEQGSAAARDRMMAARLRDAYAKRVDARWIVVTGNVHAMKFKPAMCPDCQVPMVAHLADLEPFSINVFANAGAFRGCESGKPCGEIGIKENAIRSGRVDAPDTPFDYDVILPRFTPAQLP